MKADLLRYLLRFRHLWRFAHSYILKNYEHVAGTQCLVCDAEACAKNYRHEVEINYAHQTYCRKCGLSAFLWGSTDCKGRSKVKAQPVAVNKSATILPMNW